MPHCNWIYNGWLISIACPPISEEKGGRVDGLEEEREEKLDWNVKTTNNINNTHTHTKQLTRMRYWKNIVVLRS